MSCKKYPNRRRLSNKKRASYIVSTCFFNGFRGMSMGALQVLGHFEVVKTDCNHMTAEPVVVVVVVVVSDSVVLWVKLVCPYLYQVILPVDSCHILKALLLGGGGNGWGCDIPELTTFIIGVDYWIILEICLPCCIFSKTFLS